MYRVWNYVTTYSVLLILGALIALAWANLDPGSYLAATQYPLWFTDLAGTDAWAWVQSHGAAFGIDDIGDVRFVVTPHFLVNDLAMAFFFAFAAKEVWEAVILRSGALRGRKAATPLIATLGGMAAPAALYLGLAALLGSDTYAALAHGWAIPATTDIAISYLAARLVFGAGHPAVRFVLLVAIADDAAGLAILALAYPPAWMAPGWLALPVAASALAWLLFNWLPRRLDRGNQLRPVSTFMRERLSFWPYLAAGAVSWVGFVQAGVHPALGLLPVIPAIPHADRAFGIFSEAEHYLTDLLNHIQTLLRRPVEVILLLFGLANAGVSLGAADTATWLVLAALLAGKPAGIALAGWIAARVLRLGLPEGMRAADLPVAGCVAAAGFTLALFIAGAALEAGPLRAAATLGVVLSLSSVLLALVAARLLGVTRRPDP